MRLGLLTGAVATAQCREYEVVPKGKDRDMPAPETVFQRSWVRAIEGAYVSYGAGADIDAAFDDAALSDRFEFGSSGVIPSLDQVDPAGDRVLHAGPLHRHTAWREAIRELPQCPSGALHAIPVAPLKAYRHRTANVTWTDPAIVGPDGPDGLWCYEELLVAASTSVELGDAESVVSGVQARKPSVRYKAAAEAFKGPKEARYVVVPAGQWAPLGEFTTASEARRFALGLARDKSNSQLSLEIRQVSYREGHKPLIAVTRTPIACRRPLRLLVAAPKHPERDLATDGWLFFGRVS